MVLSFLLLICVLIGYDADRKMRNIWENLDSKQALKYHKKAGV